MNNSDTSIAFSLVSCWLCSCLRSRPHSVWLIRQRTTNPPQEMDLSSATAAVGEHREDSSENMIPLPKYWGGVEGAEITLERYCIPGATASAFAATQRSCCCLHPLSFDIKDSIRAVKAIDCLITCFPRLRASLTDLISACNRPPPLVQRNVRYRVVMAVSTSYTCELFRLPESRGYANWGLPYRKRGCNNMGQLRLVQSLADPLEQQSKWSQVVSLHPSSR